MIELTDDVLRQQTVCFLEALSKGNKAALMFDDFISNTLKSLYQDVKFPKKILLPKALDDLVEGDFSPAEEITMEEPYINDIPIWRGSTLRDNGFVLRGAGYINGDSRKPCNIALDDNVPHGLLGGATGHGKSVTLNSIIIGGCLEYPPWEVQFFLVDAKIVEMKAYGVNAHIPHISSIAATSDAEYIISVLEEAYRIMMLRNSAFTAAGTKNIKSFREKTGLAMPHIVIPIDEFQTMFINAARKSKFINELIVKVARLGRNTGVHLLLSSQEIGSELDKGMLGNIGTRLCLGCMPATSTQILGNDEAKINFKQKGRLIINNNPAKDKNMDENVHLRTPFLPDIPIGKNRTIFDYMSLLESFGKSAKEKPFYNLSFYDEEARCYEDAYISYLSGKVKPTLFYLGEPSFVLRNEDGEKWLRLELREDIGQNILCFSPMVKNRERYLHMLFYNLVELKNSGFLFQVKIFYTNKETFKRIDVGLTNKPIYTRDFDSNIESAINAAFWRKIMIECDEIAFSNVSLNDEDMEIFDTVINKNQEYPGELWKKRAQVLFNLLRSSYKTKLGFQNITDKKKLYSSLCSYIVSILNLYKNMKHDMSKVVLDSFVPQYVFVVGLELLSGVGVDGKTQKVEAFKKIINESPEYKVYFIISTASLEDCYSIRTAITHVLCDNLTTQMQGHLKIADYYPDSVEPFLGVYYLSTAETNRCRKFKKMIYKGEVF